MLKYGSGNCIYIVFSFWAKTEPFPPAFSALQAVFLALGPVFPYNGVAVFFPVFFLILFWTDTEDWQHYATERNGLGHWSIGRTGPRYGAGLRPKRLERDCGGPLLCCGNLSAGEGVTVLPLDVTSEESCTAFVKKALGMESRVDVLVCAAAQLVLGSCENTTVDELDRLLDVNVLGAVRMIRRALPLMRAQKSGKIILFSSINGLLGIPFQSAYTASKHALEGYAECLAMETEPFGIQVCLVEPGDHRGGSSHTRLHAKNETDTVYRQAYENTCAIIHHDEENGLFPDRLGLEDRAERPATAYALPSEGRQARPASGRAFAYPSSRQPESENSLFLLSCSSLRQVSEGTF